jgi:uncharacterized iron-regulated protein
MTGTSTRWISHALLLLALALMPAVRSVAAGAAPAAYSWEDRLRGDSIVLLGEVHDNATLQKLRFEVLQRAVAAGWRPAIAMEQFDRGHQQDIEQARRLRPLDVDYLIKKAAPAHGSGGWDWAYYRPYVALALQYQLPLLAANLSRSDAEKIVSHGYAAVFDPDEIGSLGLNRARPKLLLRQEHEVDEGHCHLLPRHYLPGMAHAQFARDALMAAILQAHSANGIVLLAGDGHVQRDLDVPQWLGAAALRRTFSVGFEERGSESPAGTFDAHVLADPAQRSDQCADLQRSLRQPSPHPAR